LMRRYRYHAEGMNKSTKRLLDSSEGQW